MHCFIGRWKKKVKRKVATLNVAVCKQACASIEQIQNRKKVTSHNNTRRHGKQKKMCTKEKEDCGIEDIRSGAC